MRFLLILSLIIFQYRNKNINQNKKITICRSECKNGLNRDIESLLLHVSLKGVNCLLVKLENFKWTRI